MLIIRLLGKIVDDVRHGLSHFECWQDGDAVKFDCYDEFIDEEIESVVDVEMGVDYSVTFRANEDCQFEIDQIGYTDENGVQMVFDVAERIKRDIEADGLLNDYYSLCERVVELA